MACGGHMTSNTIKSVRDWLEARLAPPDHKDASGIKLRRVRLAIICAAVFAVALGVRILHWQDSYVEIERGEGLISSLVNPYRAEVARMFDDKEADPRDARMILHPPGYSILIATIYGEQPGGESYRALRLIQIICDSAAAVMIFLIAAELFPLLLAAL